MKFASLFYLCFLGAICVTLAATNTIDVQQVVTDEGNGQTGQNGGGGFILPIDATPPGVYDVKIYDVDQTSAKISWRTNEVCLAELYYGKTMDFGSGPMAPHPDSYEDYHEVSLSALEPGVKYYLKIVVQNQKGVQNTITNYSFYTVPEFLTVPNVGSLTGEQVDKTIVLDWENPVDENFLGVQINKQIGSPAMDITEGEKVFTGMMDTFVDANIADKTTYYYTVFSYDAAGNFSSGVFTSVTTEFAKPPSGEEEPTPPVVIEEKPVNNVVNLQATPYPEEKKITISWQCPQSQGNCQVEIRRDTNFPSFLPDEGDLVYSGFEDHFDDTDVKQGQIYYYTVFVKNEKGAYSTGRLVAAGLDEESFDFDDIVWNDLTFVDVRTGVVLEPKDGEEIGMLQDGILGVNYGTKTALGNLKEIVIRIDGSSYALEFNEDTQSYKTSFVVPDVGEHEMKLDFINQNDEIAFEKDIRLKVLLLGKVYAMENERLFASGLTWKRFVCRLGNILGGYDEACMSETGVQDAEVTVYYKTVYVKEGNEVWQLWDADRYKQFNPSLTDSAGRYGLTVSNGEYEILVERRGFENARRDITVDHNVINENVKLYKKKGNRYGVLLLIISLILIAIYMKKRASNKRKKRNEGAGTT